MITEEWEGYDELLRKRKALRPEWHIVRKDEATLLTSLGSLAYHKTLFKNKHTGEHGFQHHGNGLHLVTWCDGVDIPVKMDRASLVTDIREHFRYGL